MGKPSADHNDVARTDRDFIQHSESGFIFAFEGFADKRLFVEFFIEPDQQVGRLSVDFASREHKPRLRFAVIGVEKLLCIRPARMNLHGKLFRRVQQLGQNRGRFPVPCKVRGTEDLLRVHVQEFGERVHNAIVFDLADTVSGRMVSASVALDA